MVALPLASERDHVYRRRGSKRRAAAAGARCDSRCRGSSRRCRSVSGWRRAAAATAGAATAVDKTSATVKPSAL